MARARALGLGARVAVVEFVMPWAPVFRRQGGAGTRADVGAADAAEGPATDDHDLGAAMELARAAVSYQDELAAIGVDVTTDEAVAHLGQSTVGPAGLARLAVAYQARLAGRGVTIGTIEAVAYARQKRTVRT